MSSLIMQLKLTEYQRLVLERLSDKIESSKTYAGTNLVNQSFSCKPEDVFKEYHSDYADFNDVMRFDTEMKELDKLGLVKLEYDRSEIKTIYGEFDCYGRYCELLSRKEKKEEANEYRRILQGYLGITRTLENYCKEQIERLNDNKKISTYKSVERLKKLLDCIKFIETNHEEIMERELSIILFSDSKAFEKNYRSSACTIMKNYGDYSELIKDETDTKIINKIILAANNVVDNPTYIYIKGNGTICYGDGVSVTLSIEHPLAINSRDIRNIDKLQIHMKNVMTVENLTSFNRVYSKDTFLVYLSGYNNTAKSNFLKQIAKTNDVKKWLHFGDIDPDGFYILEHLKESTGLDIQPYKMGVSEFSKYTAYIKELEKQDIVKAHSLLRETKYQDELTYMLDKNCKLEQEIISWKESEIIAALPQE